MKSLSIAGLANVITNPSSLKEKLIQHPVPAAEELGSGQSYRLLSFLN
jgi:hypothetical protein